jgi:hypothetical protein
MPTIADFNRAVDQLSDLARDLGVHATSADFQEETDNDDQPAETVTIFFDHPEANPLTLDARQ